VPLLVLFAAPLVIGFAAGFATWRYPMTTELSAQTVAGARTVGESLARHRRLRLFLDKRLDPAAVTGLLMTAALVLAVGGGLLLAALAYLVRSNASLLAVDRGVAKWGNSHSSVTSTHILNTVTQFGNIDIVIVLALVLAVAETIRERSIWVFPFVLIVLGGEELIMTTVKQLVDRARPTFNPAAATLGPSFPSGHSATAAAFYAAAALLLGRWRERPVRAVLAGLAVGIAVAVAASRVLLDVHWLSDVIAGLALGWAWFAICAIAFGGRILRFGATAEAAARAMKSAASEESTTSAGNHPAPSARRPVHEVEGQATAPIADERGGGTPSAVDEQAAERA
jgi:membrane-associated phospholipid phosphatase